MSTARDKALKSKNLKWLVLLALLDMLIAVLLTAPSLDAAAFKQYKSLRAALLPLIPVAILLLTNILPPDLKATLVFWRRKGYLPGSEAFSKLGPDDPRIDMEALTRSVGPLPSDPAEQNAKWFKLYKAVGNDPIVSESHKNYLLFRDMAAMSILLSAAVPTYLLISAATVPVTAWTAGLFGLQYLACALAARSNGVRLVCNVMSLHSTRKIATKKT